MTEDEHKLVQEFARGESYHTALRPQVEAIYKRDVRDLNEAFPLYMQFLSEVFSPVPDLMLRSMYRKRVAAGER